MSHSQTFTAILLEQDSEKKTQWSFKDLTTEDLMPGDVLVEVSHSTINYKDGLAITGKSPVVRTWPMIPGVDFVGTVKESSSQEFNAGDEVILNGWGVGERHFGGYAKFARVKSDWLIHKPASLTPAECMAIGTAGYTSMLCVQKIEDQGIPKDKGPILVTGAAGGVGSVAVMLLAELGYNVIAATGRPEERDFLVSLGASDIVDRNTMSGPAKPLSKELWASAIDVAGGNMLANVISQTMYGGVVAACGLAQSMDLPSSVAPFILRGVTLAGVDSVMAPKEHRIKAWNRLAEILPKQKLESGTENISLRDVPSRAEAILEGKVRGRLVVDLSL